VQAVKARVLAEAQKRHSCSWSKPKYRDQLFRLPEGGAHRRMPLKQKEAYGLDPAQCILFIER